MSKSNNPANIKEQPKGRPHLRFMAYSSNHFKVTNIKNYLTWAKTTLAKGNSLSLSSDH